MTLYQRATSLAILGIFFLTIPSFASKTKSSPKKATMVNYHTICDSILVLADNYADASIDRPEMAPTRLNLIKTFYNRQPKTIQDSLRKSLFNMFADYTELSKTVRADAFRDIFLSIAPDTDEHLGPLYSQQILVAKEQVDTVTVKKYIGLLEDYATRMNYDYDEEIFSAKKWIKTIRNQLPINEALMGVWVSERVGEELTYIPSIGEMFITDIDGINEKYQNIILQNRFISFTSTDIIRGIVDEKNFWRIGYQIPDEVTKAGEYLKHKSYYFEILSPSSWLYKNDYYETFAQVHQYNNNLRSAYALWSNDILHSFNADYYSLIRQNMQNNTAYMSGELSRERVSSTTRFWGNIVNQSMWQIGNSIIDRLAVSTAHTWINEITFRLDSPYKLTAWIHTQSNVAKSNSSSAKTRDNFNEGITYLKWEPSDDVFFIELNENIISLVTPTKAKKKELKQLIRREKQAYKKEFGKFGFSNKKVKQWIRWFNTKMFNKLKEKAENYIEQ